MHILYIHQHFSTPVGSTGTRSYEFSRALIDAGHKVTVVCGDTKIANSGLSSEYINGVRKGCVDNINIIQIAVPYSNYDGNLKRMWRFVQFSLRTIKAISRESFDIVYATSTPLTVAIPALYIKWFKGKKMIFEVRDLWPELPKAMGVIKNPIVLKGMDVLESLAYSNADACVGLAPGICKGIEKKTKCDKKVTLIPNGCDIHLFTSAEKDRSCLAPYGIGKEDFVAIFSGAHGVANGLSSVLEAAKIVKKSGSSRVKFLFIGDGKLKPELQADAKVHQLENCIFVDPLPKKDLVKILRSADVGLMVLKNVPAFYYGTSPNKFFDYLSCGLPILNNYPGWVADLINENKCGVSVLPDNPDAFADAITFLSQQDPKRLSEMGERALLLAKKQFDRGDLAKECIKICEDTCSG